MGVVFVTCILLALLAFLLTLYTWSKWSFDYWQKRNVVHPKPVAFFGNYKDFITLKKPNFKVAHEICCKFPDEPYIGTYYGTKPALIIKDAELIKLIMTKDYSYFSSRECSEYADREIITRNMFFTYGDRWKVIRQNTSSLFTASKIRNMFPLVGKCVNTFDGMLDYERSVNEVLDIRSLMTRYTMDCIGSCGFGVETDTMGKAEDKNAFRKIGELIFDNSNIRGVATYVRSIWPAVFYGLGLSLFPKTIHDFFSNLLIGVFKERQYKPSTRNDVVDAVLNLKQYGYISSESIMKSKKGEVVSIKIDDEFLVSQCILFFGAGFETSSSTSSFTFYHLARDQEVQRKVHEEIVEYMRRKQGKIEYDCVSELPFLEACIDETMRMYPALGVITREVLEPYEMPSGLKLEPGLRIHLPVYHLHHNPEYFPEPEEYRPERFLPESKDFIRQYTYMPFGEGPRLCPGKRLAKMQMIPGLITVLRKYRLELAEGTPRKLTMDPRVIVTQTSDALRLKFIRRD